MRAWLEALGLEDEYGARFDARGYRSIKHIELVGLLAEDLDYLEVSDGEHRRRLLESAAVFGACPG